LDSDQGFSNSLDPAQGFSNSWIQPKAFLVILYWSFWMVILDGYFGRSFWTVSFRGHFCRSLLVIENYILTQILAPLQWRNYQQLIVGIILLIVKII
jgi:hypothetical protein